MKKLDTWHFGFFFFFGKSFANIYMCIHMSIYLLIMQHVNINVKEYLQSKHVGYIHK